MILLENIKRIAEKATGWRRPDDPQALLRERKPQTYQFTDDGVIPNHPTPRPCLKSCLTAEAGGARGTTASSTMPTIIRASMKSWHRAGQRSRAIRRKKGTHSHPQGRRCGNPPRGHGPPTSKRERRFLVVGAYPASGGRGPCRLSDRLDGHRK